MRHANMTPTTAATGQNNRHSQTGKEACNDTHVTRVVLNCCFEMSSTRMMSRASPLSISLCSGFHAGCVPGMSDCAYHAPHTHNRTSSLHRTPHRTAQHAHYTYHIEAVANLHLLRRQLRAGNVRHIKGVAHELGGLLLVTARTIRPSVSQSVTVRVIP